MTTEEIERFLKNAKPDAHCVKITFKKREAIYGLFVMDKDYSDLKTKNFWRIVPQNQIASYNQSRNINLAKIFSGSEFSKLTSYSESFDTNE